MAKEFKPKYEGAESKIREALIKKLTSLGWMVIIIHGNLHTFGFPDLFCTHMKYGIRLVEIKNPIAYAFTAAQLETFPKLMAHGAGVWILTSDSDEEIGKLFKPANWYIYLMNH